MKKKHVAFLISAVVCIEILACTYVLFFFWRKEIHEKSPVLRVASHCESVYALPQDMLQALIALSPEEKNDLSAIDLHGVERRITQCPAIFSARVRKLSPGTLVVDYSLKEPLFVLGTVPNQAVDKEGNYFPLEPYFPNIKVPLLFLSNKELFPLCLQVEKACSHMSLALEEIDASDVEALGLFRREVRIKALSKNSEGKELVVRLPVDTICLALKRLSLLLKQYPDYSGVIDLRFPGVGYLEQFFVKGSHELPVHP